MRAFFVQRFYKSFKGSVTKKRLDLNIEFNKLNKDDNQSTSAAFNGNQL